MKSFCFTSPENKCKFPVTLPNGKVLHLLPPKKALYGRLQQMSEETTEEEMYEMMAEALSCNLQRKKIASTDLEMIYDFDVADVISFLNAYAEYLTDIIQSPN